jgi:protein gp37
MNREWVTDIRDQCLDAEVPFFFKQWGGTNKKRNGRSLDDQTWDETPEEADHTKRRDARRDRCAGVLP